MILNANIGIDRVVRCQNCHEEIFSFDNDLIKKCNQCGKIIREFDFDKEIEVTQHGKVGQSYVLQEYQDRTLKTQEYLKQMKDQLNLQDLYPEYLYIIGDTPLRIIQLAQREYLIDKGSNLELYCGAALYISLRLHKAPFLLMDFSKILAINVKENDKEYQNFKSVQERKMFKLARCYRKLVKFLSIRLKINEKMPEVDPLQYVGRFCTQLQFGEKTEEIRETALKILKKMKLDWMALGRRPTSLCGASILIAAQVHGVQHISTEDVCKIVYVCDETIKKRLQEFKHSELAKVDIHQLKAMSSTDLKKMKQLNPPSLFKSQKKELENIASDLKIKTNPKYLSKISTQIKKEFKEDSQKLLIKRSASILKDIGSINRKESLSDLSDYESQQFILTTNEQILKKSIWDNMNKEWIEIQNKKQVELQKLRTLEQQRYGNLNIPSRVIVPNRSKNIKQAQKQLLKQIYCGKTAVESILFSDKKRKILQPHMIQQLMSQHIDPKQVIENYDKIGQDVPKIEKIDNFGRQFPQILSFNIERQGNPSNNLSTFSTNNSSCSDQIMNNHRLRLEDDFEYE